MAALGNLIWFVFGGELLGLFWLIISGLFYLTIVGIPFGRACLEFAKLSAFPFGKEIIRDTELFGKENVAFASKGLHLILNIIWLIIGIPMTIAYFAAGIISFVTIIGIPVGIVYVRMGKFLISPFGARVVSKKQAYASAVANEVENRNKG
jgi:uncharacterized membrane protein YccF (DUF307 family)